MISGEEFISESIQPLTATSLTGRMAIGEPGMPQAFLWRGKTFRIKEVLRMWRKTGACRHGSAERYVRKHFYRVVTEAGEQMTLYFMRQPLRGKPNASRWVLFSRTIKKETPASA